MAEEIRAEIVANVMSVHIVEGQQVAEGEAVVILESMKMEIPVVAEYGGLVSRVAVRKGDVVQEHDLIAVLD